MSIKSAADQGPSKYQPPPQRATGIIKNHTRFDRGLHSSSNRRDFVENKRRIEAVLEEADKERERQYRPVINGQPPLIGPEVNYRTFIGLGFQEKIQFIIEHEDNIEKELSRVVSRPFEYSRILLLLQELHRFQGT